jgi:hypothetical protein
VHHTIAAEKKPKAPVIISTDRVTRSSTKVQVNTFEPIYSAQTLYIVNDDLQIYDEAMSGPLQHE